MKNFSLVIEYQCPQCGAPATLTETDRLFTCEFCKVRSYLIPGDYFRYALPMRKSQGKEIIYFPYWRFKGTLFSCVRRGVQEKLINMSNQGIESQCFPLSLQFRDQVLKMRFVSAKDGGTFLYPKHTFQEVMKTLKHRFESLVSKPVYHQAYVGETLSLIYSPYYVNDELYDAVLNEPVKFQPDQSDVDLSESSPSTWSLKFLPTLCPNCAWDLEGCRDALVLICRNCHSAWQPDQDRLTRLRVGYIPPEEKESDIVYLPFWRIRAQVAGIHLDSYADLAKIANLPDAIRSEWHEIPFYFWGLGFRIRPKMLPLATKMTLCQPLQSLADQIPEAGKLHPVTLPVGEAVEALKITLANLMGPHDSNYPKLHEIMIEPQSHLLVYVPFVRTNLELIQSSYGISLLKNQLSQEKTC